MEFLALRSPSTLDTIPINTALSPPSYLVHSPPSRVKLGRSELLYGELALYMRWGEFIEVGFGGEEGEGLFEYDGWWRQFGVETVE